MACDTCTGSTPIAFDVQYFYNPQCFTCADAVCGNATTNSKCVIYTGSNLPCSGILTNDTIEAALVKIDAQICSITGDYSTYEYNCLTPVDTEAEFVDEITAYVCTLRTDLDTFIDTTFVAYQSTVNLRFVALEVPGITCATASVTNTDTLQQVLTKYCTKLTSLQTAISLSGITWDDCFTVVSTPTTIALGFQEVLSQICQTKALISTIGTFDNTDCLAGGLTDSLTTTIGLLKTYVCTLPTIALGEIDFGCLATSTTLQEVIEDLIVNVNNLIEDNITFDAGDFVVTATNGLDPCAGRTVSLATHINQDRLVATSAADDTPGYLIDKLNAGTNITITETGSNPNKQVTVDVDLDHKVLADAADDTPGFLVDKLEGSTVNGITITPVYNPSTKKVTLQLTVDEGFCLAVNACVPVDCASYEVTNTSGSASAIQWVDCSTGNDFVVIINDSSTITVCAQVGTVSAPNCVVINIGICTTTTSTTTSTTTTTV